MFLTLDSGLETGLIGREGGVVSVRQGTQCKGVKKERRCVTGTPTIGLPPVPSGRTASRFHRTGILLIGCHYLAGAAMMRVVPSMQPTIKLARRALAESIEAGGYGVGVTGTPYERPCAGLTVIDASAVFNLTSGPRGPHRVP